MLSLDLGFLEARKVDFFPQVAARSNDFKTFRAKSGSTALKIWGGSVGHQTREGGFWDIEREDFGTREGRISKHSRWIPWFDYGRDRLRWPRIRLKPVYDQKRVIMLIPDVNSEPCRAVPLCLAEQSPAAQEKAVPKFKKSWIFSDFGLHGCLFFVRLPWWDAS